MRPATLPVLAVLCAALPAFAGEAPAPSPRAAVAFEERSGKRAAEFPFLARGEGWVAFVGASGAKWSPAGSGAATGLRLDGASPAATVAARDALPGRVRDFRGPRPAVRATYGGVKVASAWPGVDVDWRVEGADLRYDLSFAPGTDPAIAVLAAEGATGLSLDSSGELLVAVPGGVVRHSAPVAWQEDGGLRFAVRASFVLRGGDRFGFRVEGRDARLPLVIDPVVGYSRAFGGSGRDAARAVRIAADGSLFVAGVTASDDFPAVGGPGTQRSGGEDAFLARIAADGTTLFTAILGGSGDDEALGLALDPAGNPWVAGSTGSSDFPTTAALQNSFGGGRDGFLARVSADGAALLSSTFLGGHGDERAVAVAVDGNGAAWLSGSTASDDFPVTQDAAQPVPAGGTDAFLVRIAADGSAMDYGTFWGGGGDDEVRAMAIDSLGGATVVGRTDSPDFPGLWALAPQAAGGTDAFAFRFDGSGVAAFSTMIGGSGDDAALAVVSDAAAGLVIAGSTGSDDFPLANAMQEARAGGSDGFLMVLTLDGQSLVGSTYLGGSGDDEIRALGFTPQGLVVAAGATASEDFPLRAAAVPAAPGGGDGFLVRLAANLSSVAYGTYVGGAGADSVDALAVASNLAVVLAGETAAPGAEGNALLALALLQPPAPGAPSPAGLSHDRVSFSWTDASGGREAFEVDRRFDGGPWETVAVLTPGTTAWDDFSVTPATQYDYRLRGTLEGLASEYTATFLGITLPTPPPAVPGKPVVDLAGGGLRVRWEDRSDDEIQFHVFRSVDGGPSSLVMALAAGTTEWIDLGLVADRSYAYRVRSVGTAGPSVLSDPTAASMPATLSGEALRGKRVDSAKAGRDSIDLTLHLAVLAGGSLPDLRAKGLVVGFGDGAGTPLLTIPAGSAGWTEKKGRWTWKTPKGSTVKAVVTVDPATGTVRVKMSRIDLPATAAGAQRAWFRTGLDAGSAEAPWTLKKPGTLVF